MMPEDHERGARIDPSEVLVVCPTCGCVETTDDDGCCLTCGRDAVVVVGRHSAEVVEALGAELDELQGYRDDDLVRGAYRARERS